MTSKAELREEIAAFKLRVETLLDENGILDRWRRNWLQGYSTEDQVSLQTTHGAWSELLRLLGVDSQTMAVYRIEALLKNKDADKAILAINQAKAQAESDVRIHKLAIRQLEFQRDRAQKEYEAQNFYYVNTKARCEELEDLLRDMIPGLAEDLGDTSRRQMLERVIAMLGDDE